MHALKLKCIRHSHGMHKCQPIRSVPPFERSARESVCRRRRGSWKIISNNRRAAKFIHSKNTSPCIHVLCPLSLALSLFLSFFVCTNILCRFLFVAAAAFHVNAIISRARTLSQRSCTERLQPLLHSVGVRRAARNGWISHWRWWAERTHSTVSRNSRASRLSRGHRCAVTSQRDEESLSLSGMSFDPFRVLRLKNNRG